MEYQSAERIAIASLPSEVFHNSLDDRHDRSSWAQHSFLSFSCLHGFDILLNVDCSQSFSRTYVIPPTHGVYHDQKVNL